MRGRLSRCCPVPRDRRGSADGIHAASATGKRLSAHAPPAPSQLARAHAATVNLRSIFSGSAGNLVEYFDWYVYASFSLYFAPVFFPSGSQTVQLMNTAAVFAIGFLVRPIGGLLLGRYADRRGRKTALILSVLLMGGGSLLIAFTPGYDRIGVARAGDSAACTHPAGREPRRRVRHLGDLSQRDCANRPARILFELSVRHDHHGAAARARRADRPAARAADGAGAERVGLAHPVSARRHPVVFRDLLATHDGRAESFHASARAIVPARRSQGAAAPSARALHRGRVDGRRHRLASIASPLTCRSTWSTPPASRMPTPR